MERVVAEQHLRPLRRVPGEFDSGFYGFGPRVAEEGPTDPVVGPGDQLFSQQARQEGTVHLDHIRKVELNRLVQRRFDRGMAPTQRVDAESREEVEVALPQVVVE